MLATLVPSRSSRPADLAAAHRDPFEPVVSLAHVPSREGVSLAPVVVREPFWTDEGEQPARRGQFYPKLNF